MKTESPDYEKEKKLAAEEAIQFIKPGMVVGLGSGSTARYMIHHLGKQVADGLMIRGVASSEDTERLAMEAGIPLTTLEGAGIIDINIDGADEFNTKLQLIKGGGGALLREKVIAHNSKLNVIIADSSKMVARLGKFKLPVETIPFATQNILAELKEAGLKPVLRMKDGSPYVTDENNYIVDIDILGKDSLEELQQMLINIPGLVETGLFLNLADRILMGKGDSVLVLEKKYPP